MFLIKVVKARLDMRNYRQELNADLWDGAELRGQYKDRKKVRDSNYVKMSEEINCKAKELLREIPKGSPDAEEDLRRLIDFLMMPR